MTTYSISLDDVDLALLPVRTHKYNDFLKKEHFQFQILKTEEVEEPQPTIHYKCHICAIDVPAAFAREHTASLKHRANARIARVATQRTRALINALPPPHAPQTARFCANCSTIARKNHEKTKEHRVAVMHDKLLWELMTAYVGDDTGEDSDLSDTDESVHEASRYYDATCYDVNYNKEEKRKECEPKVSTSETSKKAIDRKEDNKVEKQNDTKPLDNETKVIEVTYNKTTKPESSKSSEITNTVTETNKSVTTDKEPTQSAKNEEVVTNPPKVQDKIEYVEFVSKNNKIVKVFSDYYHSFSRKGETICCKICSTVFNSAKVDSHMFSLKHLNKMPSNLIDEHCVRKIDEVFSHCILCNSLVKHTNLAKHCLTIGHSQREKQVVSDNPNIQATSNLKLETLNQQKPKLNLEVKTVNAVASKSPEVKAKEVKSIDWPVIYPFEVTKQGVRCVICDCLLPNNLENRKDHLVGLNHVENVKNKKTCKLEYPFEATKDESIARCAICVTKVPITERNLKEHLDGLNHATNENNKKMRAAKAFKPTKKANVARCIVCNIDVPNTLRNLLDHLFGSNHVKKEQSKRETQQQAVSQPTKLPQPSTSGHRTYESTSDTIGKSQSMYFSRI